MAESVKYKKRAEDFSYTFEHVTPENFELVESFYQEWDGADEKIQYLRWKYLDCPAGAILIVARDGFTKQVIGFQGLLPLADTGSNARYLISDSIIDTNHRKRGIIRRSIDQLVSELTGESELIASNADLSEAVLLKCGLINCSELKVYVKPDMICKYAKKADFDPENLFATEASNALSRGWRPNGTNSSGYYQWLFANPNIKYVVVGSKHDHRTYVLFRIHGATIQICDHGIENNEAWTEIIHFLNGEVVRKGFERMIWMCPSESEDEQTAKKFGFLHKPLVFGPYSDSWKLFHSKGKSDFTTSDFLLHDWSDYLNEQ